MYSSLYHTKIHSAIQYIALKINPMYPWNCDVISNNPNPTKKGMGKKEFEKNIWNKKKTLEKSS